MTLYIILSSISFILLGIFILIILIDITPVFSDWLARIHIGRYNDMGSWNEAISKVGVDWLNNTPKIKVTDNTRLTIIDRIKGNYSKDAVQYWQEAALLLGLAEYLKCNSDEKAKKQVRQYVNKKFDTTGDWNEKPMVVDAAIVAYAVMNLDFIELNHYKKGFDSIWEMIKDHIGKDGTVGYRKSMMDYRYVDTIGFICPFLVAYGIRFNNQESIDLAMKQLKVFEKNGMLNDYSIPFHAYKVDKKLPLGLCGWGRGIAWYATGLIDMWNELPQNHNYKEALRTSIKRFAENVITFQQANGSWNWTVTRNEARSDSSTTAVLAWFLVNVAFMGEVNRSCMDSARKAIHYLMTNTRRSGAVDFSQGDTKDIGVYSMLFNILPFTQGYSIRAVSFYMKGSIGKGQEEPYKKSIENIVI